MDYDRTVANAHIRNSGNVIVDTQYGAPIDNEYDLSEIYNQIREKTSATSKGARVKSAALGGQG